MADKNTQYYLDASQQGYRRNAASNMSALQKQLQFAVFDVTLETGYLTANDNYVLGKLGRDAFIIPNLSFIVGVSGSLDSVLKLEKVAASAGTPTALCANTTLATDGTAVQLGAASGATTGFPSITADEYLQLTIITANAAADGDVLKLVVAYLPTSLTY